MDERKLTASGCPQKDSLAAARYLEEAAEADSWSEVEELMGATDCPDGCQVELDGSCPHGWRSAALTMGLI
jgi:hypothetical protein